MPSHLVAHTTTTYTISYTRHRKLLQSQGSETAECGMHLPVVSCTPATLCIYTLAQSCRHATSLVLPAGVLFWTLPTSGLKLSSSGTSISLLSRPCCARDYHPHHPATTTPINSGLEQQPKLRRLDPEWLSRVGLLRGGADASVGVVPNESTADTTNNTNRSGVEDTTTAIVGGLDVGVGSPGATSADEDKRSKRWLLKATEHDM